MRTAPATAAAGVVVALTLVGSGCSVLQEERRCPGSECTDELTALAGEIAALPGVTHVGSTGWSSGLDNGVAGEVEAVAVGATRGEARRLAALVVDAYLDAEVEEPAVITVEVAPDPRRQFGTSGRYVFWVQNQNWDRIRAR